MNHQIRLSKGLFAIVSEVDYEYLMQWKWSVSHEGRGTKWYAIRVDATTGKRVKTRMHRVIAERQYRMDLSALVIDHLNNNSLDNRRENLEAVTQTENMRRSKGWRKKGEKYGSKCVGRAGLKSASRA